MPLRKTFLFICLISSVLCLATGYALAHQWMGAAVAILMIPAWLFARKYQQSWLRFFCLLASVGLAAAGSLIGADPLLMILGSGISLAVWDLVSLDVELLGNSSSEQTYRYENNHLQALALALGIGLAVAALGRLLTLQIPFFVMMLSIALALIGLDRVWRYIRNS